MSFKSEKQQRLSARAMFTREWLSEGRDDIGTLPVPAETKSYARMTSADVMDQPGGTARKWTKSLNLRKALTNQRGLKGFPSQDKGLSTSGGKIKENAARTVAALLDDAGYSSLRLNRRRADLEAGHRSTHGQP